MLTTKEEMISRLSLESLRAKEDILEIVDEAGRRDRKRDTDWWLEYSYSLLRDGWNAAQIIDKIKRMVNEHWAVTEELVYKLAARSECGIRSADLCLDRVGYDLVNSDLDNDRGLKMLVWLLGKGIEPRSAGMTLRRLIFGLDERRGWTDKILWFGTGSVTRGIRRLKVVNLLLVVVELCYPWRSWHFDMMESKFGKFAGMVDELVRKF